MTSGYWYYHDDRKISFPWSTCRFICTFAPFSRYPLCPLRCIPFYCSHGHVSISARPVIDILNLLFALSSHYPPLPLQLGLMRSRHVVVSNPPDLSPSGDSHGVEEGPTIGAVTKTKTYLLSASQAGSITVRLGSTRTANTVKPIERSSGFVQKMETQTSTSATRCSLIVLDNWTLSAL